MTTSNTALDAFTARMGTNLSQRDFASLIGVHYSTIAHWETGKKTPSNLALSLLKLVATNPDRAKQVLAATPAASEAQ